MAGQAQQRSFWAAHVRRFDESGLTRRQYCDRHHLNEKWCQGQFAGVVQLSLTLLALTVPTRLRAIVGT